jgi:hypothetical protein
MTTPRPAVRARTSLGLALAALAVLSCRTAPVTSLAVPDVPVYPGARLAASASDAPDLDPTESYVVPRARADDVRAWYRQAMARRGWQATSPDDGGEVTTYATDKGCWGLVSIRQDGADVVLQISQQRPGTSCFRVPTMDPGGE